MSVSAVNFLVRRLALAVVLTMGCPAPAQQTIELTKPSDADDSATSHPLPSALSAPVSLFHSRGPAFDDLPGGSQPVILNDNSTQWKNFLNQRKNWSLLTPKEILSVPTPESILGLPDAQDELGLSVEQRYLQRRDHESQMAATNGPGRSDSGSDRDSLLLRNPDDDRRLGRSLSSPGAETVDAMKTIKPFDNLPTSADRNQADSLWGGPLSGQVIDPKQTPDQLAGMERFRAMMDPATPATKSANSSMASSAGLGSDAKSHSLDGKSSAHAYTSVQDTSLKPTTLMLFGQPLPPAPAKKVSWVQPPPWLSQTPQSTTLPQRQF
ncbi:MAG: hypothetical protein P4M10_05120 [Verrucomicrobiae bacterium]|nr:hypothetical protein [Verrucomicrobiae bacterium]